PSQGPARSRSARVVVHRTSPVSVLPVRGRMLVLAYDQSHLERLGIIALSHRPAPGRGRVLGFLRPTRFGRKKNREDQCSVGGPSRYLSSSERKCDPLSRVDPCSGLVRIASIRSSQPRVTRRRRFSALGATRSLGSRTERLDPQSLPLTAAIRAP